MLNHFQLFFNDNYDAAFIMKLEGGEIMDCNNTALELFGFQDKSEVVGIEWWELGLAKLPEPMYATIKDQIYQHKKWTYIFDIQHRGTLQRIKCKINLSLFTYEDEYYCLVRAEDVTDKIENEQELRASNERLEKVLQTVPDLFFVVDRDGYYRDFYTANQNLMFTKGNRMVGRNIADRDLPKKVEIRILANLERGLETGEPQLFYYNLVIDGKDVGFEARLIPLNNYEALIIVRDITAYNRAQEELREVNDRLKKVLNNINYIIYDIKVEEDGSKEFRYISPQIEKIYGYSIEEFKAILRENRGVDLFHPDDVDSIRDSSLKLSKEKVPISHTYRMKPKNSSDYIYIQEDVFPELNEKGAHVGNFGIAKDVTDKVVAEQQLQERERILSTLFNHLPGMAYRCKTDEHWTMEIISKGCENITGYTRDELIYGRKVRFNDLIHPDYKKYSGRELLEEIAEDGTFSFEYKIIAKDGSERWVWDQGEVVRNSNGEIVAMEGYMADLTERKNSEKQKLRAQLAEEANKELEEEIKKRITAQEELAKAQELTNSIIDSSLDMIMAADNKGKITQVSPSVVRTFGYDKDELIGQNGSILYSSEEHFHKVVKSLEETGEFSGEVENIAKNGEIFVSYLSAAILKDKNGKEIGSMGVSRDITQLKEAERELKMQTTKLESIFESSANMMIYTIDSKFRITSYNSKFLELSKTTFGLDIGLGDDFLKAIKSNVKKSYHEQLENFYLDAVNGKALEFEGPMIDKHGEVIWIETFLSPIIVDEHISEISCLAHEITDKKNSERQLKESLSEKEVLLKEVHHRVKNNLQVISSILNLQSSYVKDNNTLNILRESQNRIKSMSFIHESLYQNTNFSSIRFSEYIDNLSRNLVQTYAFGKNIDLETDLEPVEVSLDQAIPCGLILNELISNALKYAFIGRSEGSVKLSLQQKNKMVTISVVDNGIGMPMNFDVDNADSLGLQLVYTLIDQLEGTINVDTQKGTKYLITFVKQP